MRAIVAVAALLVAIPASAQNRAADDAAIRAIAPAFEAAFNKRDASALGALYTADADLVVADAPIATGRAAILAGAQRDWNNSPAGRRIHITIVDLRFLAPDVALVNTRAQFTASDTKADRGTWVVVRQRDKWLLTALRVYASDHK